MAEDSDLDVHVTTHNGNVVLILTPYMASVVRELSGHVLGGGKVRDATDILFKTLADGGITYSSKLKGNVETLESEDEEEG